MCCMKLCALGCKSGCSTTRKRVSNPGTAQDTCTLRHCKDEQLVKKSCVVGEPGCRPGTQSANLYQTLVKSTPTLSHMRERGSGVLSNFSCHVGQPRSESSNQILESIITYA